MQISTIKIDFISVFIRVNPWRLATPSPASTHQSVSLPRVFRDSSRRDQTNKHYQNQFHIRIHPCKPVAACNTVSGVHSSIGFTAESLPRLITARSNKQALSKSISYPYSSV